MAIIYSPLVSSYGFSSPSFSVDANGNLAASTLATNVLSAVNIALTGNLTSNGIPLLTQTGLGSTILASNLTSVGTLTALTVNGTLAVSGGTITLTSSSTGTINNVNIGTTTPGTGAFTSVTLANNPVTTTQAANKRYVDKTATALAIALGA
jgi:hypothetical protein